MAYRKIHDDFWTDPDIEELTPEQKFFYLYLITNPNVNQIGLYEFSIKRACFETGYNTDTVSKLLDTFESLGKIKRSKKTREILVVKFYYHNKSNSPKVVKHVEGLLKDVKDTSLIQYIYSMGTASQEEEVQEEVQLQEKETTREGLNRINGCPVPESLQEEDILKSYEFYCQYMKENFNRWPTSTTTELDLHKLTELKEAGNDPVKVIQQTIQSRNKSFYELRNFNNGKEEKEEETVYTFKETVDRR